MPVTRLIYHPFDDAILNYLDEDGQRIEPTYYVPVIPMVLVNGASGIGTGWSTDVPNYDPKLIIDNLRQWIKGGKMKPMKPWYRGFKGSIESCGKGSYYSWGVAKENDKGLEITELPVRKWTQDYKEFLQGMLPGGEGKTKIQVDDIREYHTERNVHFTLKMKDEESKKVKEQGKEDAFKLWSGVNETNMVLFDSDGKIQKYKNALEIMDEFATVRMKYYKLRKEYLVHKLTLERDLLSNRARFIKMIIEKKLHINNRKKDEVVKDLTKLKFQKFGETKPPRTGFEYLLIMQIASLTKERYEELLRMAKEKAAELEKVKKTSPSQMWVTDLDRLEAIIDDMWAQDAEEDPKGGKRGKAAKSGRNQKRRRGKDEEDDGENGGEDDEAAPGLVDPMDNPFG